MENSSKTKDRLRKKLNKKKNAKNETNNVIDETNIMDMLNNMNKMLRENPEMVNKVSRCVSNIIDNKSLMENLTSQINLNLNDKDDVLNDKNDVHDQTLESSSETVNCLESLSKQ